MTAVDWTPAGDYEDIRYELSGDGIAKITIDRPEVRNAFRPQTVIELMRAFERRARGRVGRRDHPHRRGPAGVLLGRRPARARRPRLRGAAGQRRRALPRHRPARADAPAAQADRRDGRGLRGRRRPRAARAVRPHDRRRQRASSARPGPRVGSWDGGFGASLLARPRRPEEGQGDLVPLPPVRRAAGAATWASSTRSCRSTHLEEETVEWCREMLALSPFALRLVEGVASTPTRTATPASSSSRTTRTSSSTAPTRRARAARPTRRSASPTSRSSRDARDAASGSWPRGCGRCPQPSRRSSSAPRWRAPRARFRVGRVHRRAARRDLHPGRDEPLQRLLRRAPRRRHRGPPRPGARDRRRPRPAAPGADRDLRHVRARGRSAAST